MVEVAFAFKLLPDKTVLFKVEKASSSEIPSSEEVTGLLPGERNGDLDLEQVEVIN